LNSRNKKRKIICYLNGKGAVAVWQKNRDVLSEPDWLSLHGYRVYAVLILGIGLAIAVLAHQQVQGWQQSSLEAKLDRRARICQQHLQRELDHYLEAVRSINSLFDASVEVTRSEFRAFTRAPLGRHRAFRMLAWAPLVPEEQLETYEVQARKAGITEFCITELGEDGQGVPVSRRERYFPVYYLKPRDDNKALLGLDLASHPRLRAFLQRAGSNGKMMVAPASGLIPGFLGQGDVFLLSPVHEKSDKEDSLLGYAFSVFHAGELLESALSGHPRLSLDLLVLDESGPDRGQLLAFNESGNPDQAKHIRRNKLDETVELEEHLELEVPGSRWTLVARPAPAFLAAQPYWQAPLAFGAITAFSLLSTALLLATAHRGRRYQFLASELQASNLKLEKNYRQLSDTKEDLRKSEELFRQLFEQAAIGILISCSEHRILEANQKALDILGYSREELLGMGARELIHPDDLKRISPQRNAERMLAGETVNMERRYRTKSGAYIHVLVNIGRLSHYSSDQASHMVMFQDISERKRAEQKVYSLAYFDELTGLPNRRLFHERLSQAVSRSERFGECGAVLLIDIRRLRFVNDTLGQGAGDELIREVGRRIWNSLREKDSVARVAGGEFMVLADGINSGESARSLGQRILERIGEELELSHKRIYPEASIGFTLFPYRSLEPDTLIKQADMAMNAAKKSVDRIQEFAGQEDWISREFHLEQDLKQALMNEQFQVFYQSQIDVRNGCTVGLEALLRWHHPEKGLVSPAEFIPVLERTGMIGSVDAWVIRRVCQQLRLWREKGFRVRVSVNLSAQELYNDATIWVIGQALKENRLPAEVLGVEITETELMQNVGMASKILQTLSSWGVRVALDDFGKGYSCLSYLHQLPINEIKIDREFVDGLPESADSVTLVQTIIAMAHNLGKEVLAEGVEREEQRQKLCDMGCDYGQGFLWSRPQPAESLFLMDS
jgi:diguanylate cyclase (GGDEF)-like protein/PAS domain S-box-containing protein